MKLSSARGFSLIELLVTLAITGIVMSGVYGVYIASLHESKSEEHRVDIQQSQRYAIDLLTSQLRSAAYDKAESLLPTIVAAGTDYIYFTSDFNDDGDVDDDGEHMVFCKYNGDTLGYMIGNGATDSDGDGIPDIGDIDSDGDGLADIPHTHGGSNHQPVAFIEELEFYYHLSSGPDTTFPANPELIRSVTISLLARSEREDKSYQHTATMSYDQASPAAAWSGYTDGFRRRLMVTDVRFRNMGL